MEPEGSLPSSQELSTCTYPEPDQSSPQNGNCNYTNIGDQVLSKRNKRRIYYKVVINFEQI
jgi:hypothetical protein